MSVSTSFADVQRALGHCAKGATIRLATHSRVVQYNGRTYRSLPKYSEIELGHIRKMIRHLKIDRDCMSRYIPNL